MNGGLSYSDRARPLLCGIIGLTAALLILILAPRQFFPGYLAAFVFWIGVSLGCLAILMLHHLVGGEWGFVGRRILEAGASCVTLMAVLFVPILLGLSELYAWADPAAVANSEILRHRTSYLHPPWFIVRSVVYFTVWITLASFLSRWSSNLDETEDLRYIARMRRLSAGGLVAHVVLMSLAAVDWMMSLEPSWFSSIYGWMIEVSQALSAVALVIVVLVRGRNTAPFAAIVRTKHLHDYGNLLLTFVILWTYLMFAQFFIMWSGNIPEDVAWYATRKEGGWIGFGPFLIVFHFALPFALLLLRRTKRAPGRLAAVALAVFSVHTGYVAWLILPVFPDGGLLMYVAGGAAFVGIGGCWMTLFMAKLSARPPVPRFDPRFTELPTRRAEL